MIDIFPDWILTLDSGLIYLLFVAIVAHAIIAGIVDAFLD